MGSRLSTRPGTIVYNLSPSGGSINVGDQPTEMDKSVVTSGGLISLIPGGFTSLLSPDTGTLAFEQAQTMDFESMVSNAEANKTQITKQDYDELLKDVGDIQRNPLLSR